MRTDRSVLVIALLAASCASRGGDDLVAYDLPAHAARTRASAGAQGAPAGEEADAGRPPREQPVQVTVDDAVAEAITNNRTVMQARVNAAIGLADEQVARSALLPYLSAHYRLNSVNEVQRIDVGGGGSFSTAPRTVNSGGLELSFPIFAFGRHFYGWRAARLAREGAEATSAASEADIAEAVKAAAFDVLEAIAGIEVAKSNEEALHQQVSDSQALYDAGSVTKVAVLEASVEYDQAVRQREKLESAIPILKMRLNTLLGRSAGKPIEVVDDRTVRPPRWDSEVLQEEAVAQRPELRAARYGAAAAERALRSQIGAEIGELRGALAYDLTDNDLLKPQDVLTFLLTFDIPLYTGGARGARIRRARHELEIAELQARELEEQVRTEVADAYRSVIESYRDIAVAESSVTRSEESLRIQREKFRNGRATNREVLDTNALLTDSRIALVRSIYEYKIALGRLHRARGANPRAAGADLPAEEAPAAEAAPPAATEGEAEAAEGKDAGEGDAGGR